MRALVKTARGDGNLELLERPLPIAGPGWVVIRVAFAGICGTDLHILHDHFPSYPPVTLGHEFIGTVEAVGEGVDPGLLGIRVAAEPHSLACGTCAMCRRGYAELCPSKRSPGWGIDGAFASHVAMPADLLHRIPDGMADRVAILTEPMAVVVTGLERGGVEPGDVVVVIGPGPVGILAAVAARSMGAGQVVVVGRADGPRLRFAASLGFPVLTDDAASAWVDAATGGVGADLVIDATGTEGAIALAFGIIRRHGRIVAIGLGGETTIPVPWDRAVSRAADVTFAMSSNTTAWEPALSILAGAGDDLAAMTTVVPLADWATAFQAVADRSAIKVIIDPAESAIGQEAGA